MHDLSRVGATCGIWGAMTAIIIAMLTSAAGPIASADGSVLFGIVFVLAIAATITTLALWTLGNRTAPVQRTRMAKSKRSRQDRMARLVESLDDEDIYDLEALLLATREDEEAQHRY